MESGLRKVDMNLIREDYYYSLDNTNLGFSGHFPTLLI